MATTLRSVLSVGRAMVAGSDSSLRETHLHRIPRSGNLEQNFDYLRQPDLARMISFIGPTKINVLVSGGVNSERQQLARAIHLLSNRRQGAFIAIDCSELSANPFATELLGAQEVRRSYCGYKTNCFDLAYEGTLFLNNIERMSLTLQRKVLRVLKNRETFGRHAKRHQKIDVRLVAACARQLSKLVAEEAFDEELYHLLNIFPIFIS